MERSLLIGFLIFVLVSTTASANLIGIAPGTIFAPSDSNTQYVLWDVSMNKLTINNWTIYLEDHLFNIEPTIGTASIDINHWRPPDIDLRTIGGNLNLNIGGYVPNKHYRLNTDNTYHSVQANLEGQIQIAIVPCITITTTGEYDINLDGVVNFLEVSIVVSHYGEYGARGWISTDINDDGIINYLEISVIVAHYHP